jgi:hypothetical protein
LGTGGFLHRSPKRGSLGASFQKGVRMLSLRGAALAALALSLAALSAVGSAPLHAASPAEERQWLDPEGGPLPLKTDEEVEEFLRTATVKNLEDIGRGVGGAQKALLQKGDLEMAAVFRTIAIAVQRPSRTDRRGPFFRDHYIHEPAAYALSELLGLEMVPPSVERTIAGTPGSLQIFVEGAKAAVDLKNEGAKPASERVVMFRYYQMQVFDNLINNVDRNQGNILVDPHGRAWLIDHTRAFVRDQELVSPNTVRRIERGLWEKLKSLSDAELEAAIEPYIPSIERAAFLERRRLLVELIQAKIDLIGEEAVLFDHAELGHSEGS